MGLHYFWVLYHIKRVKITYVLEELTAIVSGYKRRRQKVPLRQYF
jgi:hypothetical protein